MKLGFREKIFLVSISVLIVVGSVSGVFLHYSLKAWLGTELTAFIDNPEKVDAIIGIILSQIKILIIVSGIIGLVLAVLMSLVASNIFSKSLRDLVRSVHQSAGFKIRRKIATTFDDEVAGLAASFNKIEEELKRTVHDLADERDKFRVVLDSMREVVIAVDSDCRITILNKEAENLLGVRELSEGMSFVEVVRIPILNQIIESGLSGKRDSVEFELSTDETKRLLATISPLKGSGGCVIVLHDVTEIRRLERIRRDFVANVSHELRTPVAIIKANAETLLNGALEDKNNAESFTSAILANSERLSALIADLLDLARIESGKYPFHIEKFYLEDVVSDVFDLFRKGAETKKILLEAKIESGLVVQADKKAMEHILINLIDNAVKFSPESTSVILRAYSDIESVKIEVEDRGPGIQPLHKERVFERFYKLDPSRSGKHGGTGLGLAIVKHLVESMDGNVGITSASPYGALFWITLPKVVRDNVVNNGFNQEKPSIIAR